MIFDEFIFKLQICVVLDFFKFGVVFCDIILLFQLLCVLCMIVDSFVQCYIEVDFSYIGVMDVCGFFIGLVVVYVLNKLLVLFCKQGKLFVDVFVEGYQIEYGEVFFEVYVDSFCEGDSVLIFDDFIVIGGILLVVVSLV